MAQFSHPDLGGMGQWSPGMVMVGDMFNRALVARVDALFVELAGRPRSAQEASKASPDAWWPRDLGRPSSTGAQNGMRYALFPDRRRLAVGRGDAVTVYDTGEHRIGGFGQQQGGTQSLSLAGAAGPVALDSLAVVSGSGDGTSRKAAAPLADPERATPADPQAAAAEPAAADDPLALLDRLAALHRRGVIDDSEFAAKKRQLLDRI